MFITQWLSASSPNLTISVWIILYIGIYLAFLKLLDAALNVAFNFDKLPTTQLLTFGSNLALYSLASPILMLYTTERIQLTIFAAIFVNMFLPSFLFLLPSKTIIEKESPDEELTHEVVMKKLAIIKNQKKSNWLAMEFIIGIIISIGLGFAIYHYINLDPNNIKTLAKLFAKQS